MIGIDTSVLVRALVDVDHPQHPAAAHALTSRTLADPGFISHVTLVELFWVLRKSYGIDRESILAVIQALVETEALEFEDEESVVRALSLAETGADFSDALIQGSMELFGVSETVTLDRDASRHLGWRLLA